MSSNQGHLALYVVIFFKKYADQGACAQFHEQDITGPREQSLGWCYRVQGALTVGSFNNTRNTDVVIEVDLRTKHSPPHPMWSCSKEGAEKYVRFFHSENMSSSENHSHCFGVTLRHNSDKALMLFLVTCFECGAERYGFIWPLFLGAFPVTLPYP